MILKTLSSAVVLSMALSVPLFADDEEKAISIFLNKSNNEAAKVDIKIDNVAEAFTMPELAEGESKTITTESGNTITITKTNGKLTITTEGGEVVTLPGLHDNQMVAKVLQRHTSTKVMDDSIRIMGGNLTDEQKELIKDAILSSGVDKKIDFVDSGVFAFSINGADGLHNLTTTKKDMKIILKDENVIHLDTDKEIEWISEDAS
ncbi:MAG: hypothetical protein V2I33_15885, partial [Kangiellaceae bacterium]|nr:hypothetical protein [Kangiellaceae bacterium]